MKREKLVLLIGLAFLLLLSVGKLAGMYSELLWFRAMKYASVFWTIFLTKGLTGLLFGMAFALIAGLNIYLARKMGPSKTQWEIILRGHGPNMTQIIPVNPGMVNRFLLIGCLLLSVIMGVWPATREWDGLLRFFYQTPFSRLDPIFHKDISFFVFSYPVYIFLQKWLLYGLMVTTALIGFIYVKDKAMNLKPGEFMFTRRARTHLSILAGLILLLIAWNRRLKMLGLLYSPRGVTFGASYTDMHAQLIAYWVIIVIAALCAFIFWINISAQGWKWPLVGLASLFVLSILLSGIYPWALQTFFVEPNELFRERPYIEHNIQYTRYGYNLDRIEERNFPASMDLSLADIQNNSPTMNNVKLWDKNPLMQTYTELQEMRLYYNFKNVDEDRYILNGNKTQVMLSVRELDQSKLPLQAQTWENKRFKYTHGYGLCMSPANHVTEKGLPNLVIKDIPPVSLTSAKVSRPEIYYGETDSGFVIVNTKTQEFDYPKGDSNVFTNYEGEGGVPIGSYWNRLIFSLRYSDPKILLTSYITPKSRIMFHRQIKDRVRVLAPFLVYDRDPYVVVSGTGRIFWIQDAYTTSDKYPYSEPCALPSDSGLSFQSPVTLFAGQRIGPRVINYIRNSVKAVIDAYHGTTTFYVIDEEDPIIRTYQKIFPSLFRPFSEMPEDLRSHIRYPRDLFEVQAYMYRTYHMEDTQVFYNKEDLWDLPMQQSLSGQTESPMKGYYVTMRLPDGQGEEFLLMIPFTPDNKSNMIAWLSAQCDGEGYGKLSVYKLTKDKLIYGPRQIEARIDQQTEISSELTLWSQQGSQVFRGDLLVIPVEESILYIEPVYLAATDQSNLPELKRVIVAYGEKVKMAHTLPEALLGIFGGDVAEASPRQADQGLLQDRPKAASLNEMAVRANQYYQKSMESLKMGNWSEYGHYQEQLRMTIQDILEASKGK
ncbi:MAG: UPF0182 family protein [bacterium]